MASGGEITNLPKVIAQILPTHAETAITASENKLVVTPPSSSAKDPRTFLFDRLYTADQRPKDHAFPALVKEAVHAVMSGYNTCVFGHGWKASSLLSPDFVRPLADTLFKSIAVEYKAQSKNYLVTYRVTCQCIEIVNDKVRDLCADGKLLDLTHIKEDNIHGTFCTDAHSKHFTEATQLVQVVNTLVKNRTPPSEGVHSHVILKLNVRKGDKHRVQLREQAMETTANLMLCDFQLLLGSTTSDKKDWDEYGKTGLGTVHTFIKQVFDAEQSGAREAPTVDTTSYPPPPPAIATVDSSLARPPSFSKPAGHHFRTADTLGSTEPSRRPSRTSISGPTGTGRSPRGHGHHTLSKHQTDSGSRAATPTPKEVLAFDPPPPPTEGPHFRASLLTWFMKFQIGANWKTLLYVYIDPSIHHYSDALTVLQQATRLKCITSLGLSRNEKSIKLEEFSKLSNDTKRIQWNEPVLDSPPVPRHDAGTDAEFGQTSTGDETEDDAERPATTHVHVDLSNPPLPRHYKYGQPPRLSWKRPTYKTPKVKYLRVAGGSLQMAIGMCQQGDILIVPGGVYKDPVVLTVKDLVLKAAEGQHVVLEVTGNIPAVVFRTPYARVEGFTIIQSGTAEAVLFDKGAGEVIDCDIHGVGGGISIQNHCDPLIYGNKIHDSRRGAGVLINHSKAVIEHNDIWGNTDGGVVVEKGSTPFVVNNKVHHGKGSGVVCVDNATGFWYSNDIHDNACVGVLIQTGANPHFKDNKVHSGRGAGISVNDNGKGMIEENEIYNNNGHDVEISKMGNPNLLRNKIHDGKTSGLCVFMNGRGYIEQNELWNYGTACVTVRDRGNPIIRANTLKAKKEGGSGTSGIMITENGKGEIEDNILIGWPTKDEGDGGAAIMTKTGGRAKLSNNRYLETEVTTLPLHKKRGSAIDLPHRPPPVQPTTPNTRGRGTRASPREKKEAVTKNENKKKIKK